MVRSRLICPCLSGVQSLRDMKGGAGWRGPGYIPGGEGGRRDGTDPIDPCTVHFSGGSVPVRRRASVSDAGPASNRHWDGTQIRRSIRLKSQFRLDPACRTLSIDLIDLAPLVFPFFHTFPVPGSHECIVLLAAVIASQYTIPETQNICMTFAQCWFNVEEVGPTLYKCYTNVLCLLRYRPPPPLGPKGSYLHSNEC